MIVDGSRPQFQSCQSAAATIPGRRSLTTPMTIAIAARSATASPGGRLPVATLELERVAGQVLAEARKGGATAAETEVSQGVGQSVTVRKGDVETIAYNRDKGISVTVYLGQRRGHASSADFAEASLRDTVAKALAIARFTAEDPSAGLADAERLAKRWGDLDLYHPWDLSVDEAIALGRDAEAPRCASTSASPTRTARRCRAAKASSCTRTRWASAAATGARAIRSTSR
jgi:hypothetical protein